MLVDLLLNDYFDAGEINNVLVYHGLDMIERKYTAVETFITVDTGSTGISELEIREMLEEELLVGVEIQDVY